MSEARGRVFLVGAGPGATDLLTLRGARLLRSADVVVYDALALNDLLAMAPPEALRINVGKRGHEDPTRSQSDIEEILIQHARAGKRVVRLKGGDPFAFGRGGEEFSACRAAQVPCEVVPGVSSALAVPALAGIPLTDRRFAASFAVVTGHKDPTRVREEIRWAGLARSADTLVILMAMRNLAEIADRLIEGGRAPDTPAAAVMEGSLPGQRVVEAPLEVLAERVRETGLGSPAVVVVGDVVGLRAELDSWESLPLFGRRVLVTRPAATAEAWVGALREAGAEPVAIPLIEIVPIVASPLLDAALADWERYDALLFTSANGALQLAGRARERGLDPRQLSVPAHCVGPATARAARASGFAVGELPLAGYNARALADRLLAAGDLGGRRYLLPQSAVGRRGLADALRGAGATVDVVPVYRTEPAPFDGQALRASLAEGALDAILFASPTAVRSFAHGLGADPREICRATVVALGGATAEALAELGLPADVQPESATVEACIEALARAWSGQQGGSP